MCLFPNTCCGGCSGQQTLCAQGTGPLASQGHPAAAVPCPSTASSMQEEAKAKEEEGVPDEEGWVKVTRRGRRPVLPRTEAASLRILEKEKRKRARKELLNFYAWQHRETKMERKSHRRAPHTSGGRERGVLGHIFHELRGPVPCVLMLPRLLRDLRGGVLVEGCLSTLPLGHFSLLVQGSPERRLDHQLPSDPSLCWH